MEQPLQAGQLFDVGRSTRPTGRGRSLDGDGHSLLPLSRLTYDVNRATRWCSRGADSDKASQQQHRPRETDDLRSSVSSVSNREVGTLLTSRNEHDDVRQTEHGARHSDDARNSRLTQLRLFYPEGEGRRLRVSPPPTYLEASSRRIERETVDESFRISMSPVQAGEKLVNIYTSEVEVFTRALEADNEHRD